MSKNKNFLVKLTTTAMLTAIAVFLNRFLAITSADIKISFVFVPIIICGTLFGPLWGGVCAGLGDFIAAMLMPLGPFHPGITLTAALTGIIYGTVGLAADRLKSKPLFFLSAVLAVVTEKIICTLLLNTLWLSGITGNPFFSQMVFRLPQVAILFVPEIILVLISKKYILPAVKKTLKEI